MEAADNDETDGPTEEDAFVALEDDERDVDDDELRDKLEKDELEKAKSDDEGCTASKTGGEAKANGGLTPT